MRRHAIITRIGAEDRESVAVPADIQVATELYFLDDTRPAVQRVTHELLFKELKRLGLQPTEIAMDLLVLAITVFAADTRILREVDSQDGWTRELDLYVPVSEPDIWNQQRGILENMLSFLSGDRWRFSFRSRSEGMEYIAPQQTNPVPYSTDTVCLFSGGLDSFIGAVDILASGAHPILVGHHKSADVSTPQQACVQYLQSCYESPKPEFVNAYVFAPKAPFGGVEEMSERGRSFLFISLGAICAAALGGDARLVIPENGLISLNVPLTPLRLGAPSTRTTHPYFIKKFQELLNAVGIRVHLENPYQFRTKGEMLRDCRDQAVAKEFAYRTMSCAHPSVGRWSKLGTMHCGRCVPCVIRRAAFLTAYGHDPTPYITDLHARPLDVGASEGEQVRAFQIALARLHDNPGAAEVLIYKSGPLESSRQTVSQFADLYRRGMAEVESLLTGVSTIRV